MKWLWIALTVLGVSALAWRLLRPTAVLHTGDNAPGFQLPDQAGRLRALSQYHGRWLVLYFYPRDDTPGCAREACRFRDDIQTLHDVNADVVGISVDSTASHARFAEKYKLPFPLLSDVDGGVAARYGALFKLGPLRFARRYTFIVTPDAKVARIYQQVVPEKHAQEVARAIRALQREASQASLLLHNK